jgi:hypothetical protein
VPQVPAQHASPPAGAAQSGQPQPGDQPALPDVTTLTFDSDFKPFLAPDVDEGTRRAALRKLFSDPHFNTMDGLDVYIDDYGKFEPVTPEILKQLRHARYMFDPPKTRVNEHGHVEDVVDEPPSAPAGEVEPREGVQGETGTVAAPSVSDAAMGDAGAPAASAPVLPKTPS